jgi:hypothetical protein
LNTLHLIVLDHHLFTSDKTNVPTDILHWFIATGDCSVDVLFVVLVKILDRKFIQYNDLFLEIIVFVSVEFMTNLVEEYVGGLCGKRLLERFLF